MLHEHSGEMESELDTLLVDLLPRGQAWRWTVSGYAQGMLLHLMACQGFVQHFLPPVACTDEAGQAKAIRGCSFSAIREGRTFSAYHPDLGIAVVMAALMILRTRPALMADEATS